MLGLIPVMVVVCAILLRPAHGIQTLASLLDSGSCSKGQGGAYTPWTCRLVDAVVLSGLSGPLQEDLSIVGLSGAATVLLSSELTLGSGVSIKLSNLTVANATFSASPPDPSTSLAMLGLNPQGQAALSLTGCTLALADCSTWSGLISATCELGLMPTDAIVSSIGMHANHATLIPMNAHAWMRFRRPIMACNAQPMQSHGYIIATTMHMLL